MSVLLPTAPQTRMLRMSSPAVARRRWSRTTFEHRLTAARPAKQENTLPAFAEAEAGRRGYCTAAAKEPTTTQITVQSPSDKSKIRTKYAPVSHSPTRLSAAEGLRDEHSCIGDSRRCGLSGTTCKAADLPDSRRLAYCGH